MKHLIVLLSLLVSACASSPRTAEQDTLAREWDRAAATPTPAADPTSPRSEPLHRAPADFSTEVAPLRDSPGPALGAGEPNDPDAWRFEITPYLWLAGLHGDLGSFGAPPSSVDLSFGDVLENLDFGALVAFEARHDRWGVLVDAIYLKVSADGDTPGPVFNAVEVTSETGILQSALAYRASETEQVALDVYAGARAWFVSTDLDFSGGGPSVSFDDDQSWIDPIIGARAQMRASEVLSFTLLGDAGGFGVSSDSTWQAYGGLAYRLSDTCSLKLGYRAIGVDFEDDGFVYDVTQEGFLVGVGIRL